MLLKLNFFPELCRKSSISIRDGTNSLTACQKSEDNCPTAQSINFLITAGAGSLLMYIRIRRIRTLARQLYLHMLQAGDNYAAYWWSAQS